MTEAPNPLAPSAQLPSYLQSNPWSTSQNYLNNLGSVFNPGLKNLNSAYNGQMATNWDQGRALAAAAANQYTQRAMQSGASTLGAGFAQAGAMLPVYQQNQALQSDLASKQLQYRTAQAQIGAGLSGDIGRQQGQYQSTLSDYYLNQQKLQQQQQQFGDTLGLQYSQLGQQKNYQSGLLSNQAAQLALQYAPKGIGAYSTDLQGRPMTIGDSREMQTLQGQGGYINGILGGLSGGGNVGYNPFASTGGNAVRGSARLPAQYPQNSQNDGYAQFQQGMNDMFGY